MAKFIANTEEIAVLAATMKVLGEGFDTSVTIPDLNGSKGASITEMKALCDELETAKKSFKTLVEATVKFLDDCKIRYDQADIDSARVILENEHIDVNLDVSVSLNDGNGGGRF